MALAAIIGGDRCVSLDTIAQFEPQAGMAFLAIVLFTSNILRFFYFIFVTIQAKKATANGAVAAVAEYYCIFSLFVCSKACDHVGGRIAVSFSQFFSDARTESTVQLAKCIDAGEFYSLKYVAKWRLLLIFIFHPS